jgi:hypothetical protein
MLFHSVKAPAFVYGENELPQLLQNEGFNSFISSGQALIFKLLPLCPGCPPDFFSLGLRKLTVRFGKSLERG